MTAAFARSKAATIAAALLFAGAAAASGFDRMAAADTADWRMLPAPVRVLSVRSEAADALAAGAAAAEAMQAASRAVTAEPGDAVALALLGTTLAATGDVRQADRAFRLAARLGAREPAVRRYLMADALLHGDADRAALEFDLVLRVRPLAPERTILAAALEVRPDGRAALARRLRGGVSWANDYLAAPRESDETLRRRAAGFTRGEAGVTLGCATLAPMLQALEARGLDREAAALRRRQCPGQPRG